MTRWVVTGAGGMLGRDVVAALAGRTVAALARTDLDITSDESVDAAVADAGVVVNCAAWTDVDGAETAAEQALAINGHGSAVLAEACARHGARLLHVSTDYVFAGTCAGDPATAPGHAETDPTGPRTQYGISKLAGEREVLRRGGYVVRTAWLYGEHGRNFVRTMLDLERTKPTLDVVDDQWGQPTWTRDLAARLVALGEAAASPGVYHVAGAGRTTWCRLAREVFAAVGADPERVRPTTTDKFPRPAPRPGFSVLGQERATAAGLTPMPDWAESVRTAVPLLLPPAEGN